MKNLAIGIDIGGTGIKLGVVDLTKGTIIGKKHRCETPEGARPNEVLSATQKLLKHVPAKHRDIPVGIGFPSKVVNGVCTTTVNISQEWLGIQLQEWFSAVSSQSVLVANDADVAGLAEMAFNNHDLGRFPHVLFLTLGTGIGSAIFLNGKLWGNTELGLLRYKGDIIERYASNKVRKDKDLNWKKWGGRVSEALQYFHRVFTPDIIVLGGGVSKKFNKFEKYLDLPIPVQPARLRNDAGIIGAAMLRS